MIYADFPYYQDGYCGQVITDAVAFHTASARASEYMDSVTFGRIQPEMLHSHIAAEIQNCCCALAEAFYLQQQAYTCASTDGTGAKKSETQHNYSVTYSTPAETLASLLNGRSFSEYLYSICLRYLGRTGLLYRGCD